MSALAFLVRGRSVDLVAMTALHALRDTLGLGDEVRALMRDELVVIEGVDLRAGADAAGAWTRAFTAQQHWFNPNKHRFAALRADEGAIACARDGAAWPQPWLQTLLASDRPDLAVGAQAGAVGSGDVGEAALASGHDPLGAWLAAGTRPGHAAVTLAAWDRESGVDALPAGHWPDPGRPRLRGVLWTLILATSDPGRAVERAGEIAVTRARRQGLLVNPHMEGWAAVGPARSLDPVSA